LCGSDHTISDATNLRWHFGKPSRTQGRGCNHQVHLPRILTSQPADPLAYDQLISPICSQNRYPNFLNQHKSVNRFAIDLGKIHNPACAFAIFLAELHIQSPDILLIPHKGTTQAVILFFLAIIKHIHVDFPHQAARTAEI
jgi:hypothetical protein